MSNNNITTSSLIPLSLPLKVEKKESAKLPVIGVIALVSVPIAIGGGIAVIEFLIKPGTLALFFSTIGTSLLVTPPGFLIATTAIILGLIAITIAVVLIAKSRIKEEEIIDDSFLDIPRQQETGLETQIENIPLNELFEQNIHLDEDGYPTDETCLFITHQVMVMDYDKVRALVSQVESGKIYIKQPVRLARDNNALTFILKLLSKEDFIMRILHEEEKSAHQIDADCAEIVRDYQEKKTRLLEELAVDNDSMDDDWSTSSTEEEFSTLNEKSELEPLKTLKESAREQINKEIPTFRRIFVNRALIKNISTCNSYEEFTELVNANKEMHPYLQDFLIDKESSSSEEALIHEIEISDNSNITEDSWDAQETIKRPFALLHLLSILIPRSTKNQKSRTKTINTLIDTDSTFLHYFYKFFDQCRSENPAENSIASIFQYTFDPEDLSGSLMTFLDRLESSFQTDDYDPFQPLDFNHLTNEELYTTVPFETLLFNSIFSNFFDLAKMSKKDIKAVEQDLTKKIKNTKDEEEKNFYQEQLDQYNVLAQFDNIPTGWQLTGALKGSSILIGMLPDTIFPKAIREDDALSPLKKILIEDSIIPYLLKNEPIRDLFSGIIKDLQSYQDSKEKVDVRERILKNSRELFINVIGGFKQALQEAPDELNAVIESSLLNI